MRIIIEVSDAEIVLKQAGAAAQEGTTTGVTQGTADIAAGPPSEALLQEMEATTPAAVATPNGNGHGSGESAGPPPAWLIEAITGEAPALTLQPADVTDIAAGVAPN